MAKDKSTKAGRQAPPAVATPSDLMDALTAGSREDNVKLLKKAGILDKKGRITDTYTKNWGKKISRAQDLV